MDRGREELIKEIDFLHSGLMALEKIVVSKNLVSVEELNSLIREAHDECKKNRKEGRVSIME